MLIFLIILLASGLFVLLYAWTRNIQPQVSLREVFLASIVLMGVLVVATTEGLSLFTALTATALKIVWGILLAATLTGCAILWRKAPQILSELWEKLWATVREFRSSRIQIVISLLILFHIATLAFILYRYPTPNTNDSMIYHLARTLHWEQQASVAHYASYNVLQIIFPPFAEFALLQINLLAGNDHLSATLQWMAMIVSVVGVSEIARKLGANALQQIIASLLCVSIPMGIAQATSTQNDYVNTMWLVCFVAFGLRFIETPNNVFTITTTGAALGLALLTKGTAYVIALPASVWFGAAALSAGRFKWPAWRAGLLLAAVALMINLGHYTRNYAVFGLAIGDDGRTINQEISWRVFASNTLRNIQVHSFPPRGKIPRPLKEIGRAVLEITLPLHQLTGLAPNDPLTTIGDYNAFNSPNGLRYGEDNAGNFFHLTLVFVAAPIALLKPGDKKIRPYAVTLVAAFLLFSLLLKSNAWISRLQLPMFALACALIAVTIFRMRAALALTLCLAVWAASIPWLFENPQRPLDPALAAQLPYSSGPNVEAYFAYRFYLFPIYESAAERIVDAGCDRVGIAITSGYRQEYPFWMMLQSKGFTGIIHNVGVHNLTEPLADETFSPCAVFSSKKRDAYPDFTPVQLETFWLYLAP